MGRRNAAVLSTARLLACAGALVLLVLVGGALTRAVERPAARRAQGELSAAREGLVSELRAAGLRDEGLGALDRLLELPAVPPNWSYVESVYYALATVTGVGYGDLVTATGSGRCVGCR